MCPPARRSKWEQEARGAPLVLVVHHLFIEGRGGGERFDRRVGVPCGGRGGQDASRKGGQVRRNVKKM